MHLRLPRTFALMLALFCLLFAAASARATTYLWAATTSGLYTNTGNWSPVGTPGAADITIYDQAVTYTVTINSSITNTQAFFTSGTVTLALSGQSYTTSAASNGFVIGNSAGVTGRLTLSNGSAIGDLNIGSAVGATGFLTIADDAAYKALANATDVGSSGTGTLTISNGGSYAGTAGFNVATNSGSNGTLAVSGTSATFFSGSLVIGVQGTGTATFSAGATATAASTVVGSILGSTGSLTVTGAGTSLTLNLSPMTIGSSGDGWMTVASGGAVTAGALTLGTNLTGDGNLSVSGTGTSMALSSTITVGSSGKGTLDLSSSAAIAGNSINIAANAGSAGAVTISGAGTSLSGSSLTIGGSSGVNGGTGTLTIGTGAAVTISGLTDLRNSTNSALTLNGGTLTTGDFNRLGTLVFNDGTLHINGAFTNGSAIAPLVINGTAAGVPTLQLSGNAAVSNVSTITVGNDHAGALILESGRTIFAGNNSIAIAALPLSSGAFTIRSGASFTTNTTLSVGGTSSQAGGAGVFTLSDGAFLTVGTLVLWDTAGTALNFDGGFLTVTAFDTKLNPARFHWTAGTLTFNDTLSIGYGSPLGDNVIVPPNSVLAAVNQLQNNGVLQLSSGSTLSCLSNDVSNNGLIIGSGKISSPGSFQNSGQLVISGALTIVSPSANNIGTITVQNSGFLSAAFTSNNFGTIVFDGGSAVFPTLVNLADGIIRGHGLININTSFSNAGLIIADGGNLRIIAPFTSTGIIQLTDSTANLAGGAITNNGTIQGFGKISSNLTNANTIEAVGGILNITGALTNSPSGLLASATGTKLLVTPGLATNAGTIALNGGTFDNNNQPLANNGLIAGFGTLRTGGLTNNGTLTFTGGFSLINGPITNTSGHTLNIKFNPALFTGNVTNNAGATIKTTSTTATFAGTFTNNGTFISDPATNIFQSDVTISSTGFMSGGPGDEFHFTAGTVVNHGRFDNGGALRAWVSLSNDGIFSQSGPQQWAPGTAFNNTAGTATFASDAGPTGPTLTLNASGGTTALAAAQHLAALSVSNTAVVRATTTAPIVPTTLTFAGSTNNWSGQLDLLSSALVLKSATSADKLAKLPTVQNQIFSGRNGGTWNGQGITSSTIAADATHYALALADNADLHLTTFRGEPVDDNALLVARARLGDANLDQKVDAFDLNLLAAHWQQTGRLWSAGDFTSDGKVDAFDLNALAANWQATASLEAALAGFPGFTSPAAVPEPASLALLLPALLAASRRPRRTA